MDTKTERIFRLINILKHKWTEEELAEKLQMSIRNVKRDIDELRKHGFVLMKNKKRQFWIPEKEVEKIPKLNVEESKMLRELVMGMDVEKAVKLEILEKLYYSSDQYKLADQINNFAQSATISKLTEAIKNRKQVILKSYYSVNSDTEMDRLVEPLDFSLRKSQVIAFDPEASMQKSFNLTRIKEVEILDKDQTNDVKEINHEDVFGMSGVTPIPVDLTLNKKAHAILLTQYPHAVHFIERQSAVKFVLKTDVSHIEGVGRFVLSLLNEIKVNEPQALKDWIKDQIHIYQK